MSSLFAALSALSSPTKAIAPEASRSDNLAITGAPTAGASASLINTNDPPYSYTLAGR